MRSAASEDAGLRELLNGQVPSDVNITVIRKVAQSQQYPPLTKTPLTRYLTETCHFLINGLKSVTSFLEGHTAQVRESYLKVQCSFLGSLHSRRLHCVSKK
jgi:hypothetical protein